MQRLLEQKSSPMAPFGAATGSARGKDPSVVRRGVMLLVAMIAAAYLAFFVLPGYSAAEMEVESTRRPANRNVDVTHPPITLQAAISTGSQDPSDTNEVLLQPWGYNKDRNVPRWNAIYRSIASDFGITPGDRRAAAKLPRFTLVDYGADQGYFSISTRHFFPSAVVMGLELGGVGGEIWNKGKPVKDVLQIQEEHLAQLSIEESTFVICQTTMRADHFFELQKRHSTSDYQFMLSVFHWFPLPTRRDFEKAIVTLFSNAKTTFVELPTIGDKSDLIRKQVGYKNFEAWYDGRTDVKQILLDAAEAQHAEIRVQLILSSRWVKWTREVFRVDFIRWKPESPHANPLNPTSEVIGSLDRFQCSTRREVYGCKQREKFSTCL